MRSEHPQRRGRRGWVRCELDLAKTGALLRAAGFCADEGDPAGGHGHRDRAGRVRRLHVVYTSGWRATAVIRADDTMSVSWAIKLVTTARAAR